ncbi:MAG: glycosyltransferase family 87 protein [Pirellulaceae bacterium]
MRCDSSLRSLGTPQVTSIAVAQAVLLVILIATTAANYRIDSVDTSQPLGGDFLQDWIGGHVVASGNVHQLYDPAFTDDLQHDRGLIGFEWSSTGYFPMIYPPVWYAAVSPLSHIPYRTACVLWLVLLTASFPTIAFLMHRRLRVPGGMVVIYFIVLMLFPPVMQSLIMGQKSLIWLTIWVATFALLHQHRDASAGIVFGLMLMKPIMVPVMIGTMILHRRWRFVVAAAGSALMIGGVSLVAVPPSVWLQYFKVAAGAGSYHQTGGYDFQLAQNIGALLLPVVGQYRAVYWTLFLALGIIVVILMSRLIKTNRRVSTTCDESRLWLAIIAGTILLSPHFFAYDLAILALLPVVFAVNGEVKQAFPCIAACFLLTTVGPMMTQAVGVSIMPVFLIVLLAVFKHQRISFFV